VARQREAQAQAAAQLHRVPAVPDPSLGQRDQVIKTELRIRLLERLNGVLVTRDTPRGLVITLPDAHFSGSAVRGMVRDRVALVAAIVAANPGLRVQVEGHTDSAPTETLAWKRAESVRGVLIGAGLSGAAVSAHGLGATRPLTSNASAAGRVENRRIEIVISGDPIGNLPFWDRVYTLSRR